MRFDPATAAALEGAKAPLAPQYFPDIMRCQCTPTHPPQSDSEKHYGSDLDGEEEEEEEGDDFASSLPAAGATTSECHCCNCASTQLPPRSLGIAVLGVGVAVVGPLLACCVPAQLRSLLLLSMHPSHPLGCHIQHAPALPFIAPQVWTPPAMRRCRAQPPLLGMTTSRSQVGRPNISYGVTQKERKKEYAVGVG